MKFSTKQPVLFIFLLGIFSFQLGAQTNLKLHYSFAPNVAGADTIVDVSGNGFSAKLFNGAKIRNIGAYGILETGSSNGYADLGAKTGQLISTLNDFTISTYLYIDPAVSVNVNGNFVWTFSNADNILSSPTGCMFYSAKTSRYAISLTNYTAEKQVNVNVGGTKGAWQHITYRQSGNTGEIYINGSLLRSGNVTLLPTSLGITTFNYLARSCYNGDQYLLNSKYSDFRIYNSALSQSQIIALSSNRQKLDTLIYTDLVDSALAKISLGNAVAIESNIALPTTATGNVNIQWASSNPSLLSSTGVVSRPAAGQPLANVTLTATASLNFISKTRTIVFSILPQLDNLQSVKADSASLVLAGNLTNLRSNLTLPKNGFEGSTISWSSDKTGFISNEGIILARPAKGAGKLKVNFTATIQKGTTSVTKKIEVYLAEDEGFSAYLFAYFTGNSISQEAIRFAISNNGLTYKALNNDQPIISSALISSTGGVRDPHILRGNDGWFYMVATDMVSANGWSSNRGIVLLKSSDLINWQSSKINITTTFPAEFANADRVWAPQTIYDATVGKYMIYMSIKKGNSDYDKIYYAYANTTFTALESAPKLLFDNSGLSTIDSDIIEKDGQYHLFFKTEGNGNGIKKAVSNTLTGGYVLCDKYLDMNANGVEGGCVFRLYNTDDYVLMYDVYTSGYYEFTKSIDLENFSLMSGNSFDFTPRHGTIIPITLNEKNALNTKWGITALEPSNNENSTLKLSVNKATKSILVEMEQLSTIEIFNLNGQLCYAKKANSQSVSINTDAFINGVYIIKVMTENGKFVRQKFVW